MEDPRFANQERVYNDIGKEMLMHAFEGYIYAPIYNHYICVAVTVRSTMHAVFNMLYITL